MGDAKNSDNHNIHPMTFSARGGGQKEEIETGSSLAEVSLHCAREMEQGGG